MYLCYVDKFYVSNYNDKSTLEKKFKHLKSYSYQIFKNNLNNTHILLQRVRVMNRRCLSK